MVDECDFVGHVVNERGVKAQKNRIEDIVDFKRLLLMNSEHFWV